MLFSYELLVKKTIITQITDYLETHENNFTLKLVENDESYTAEKRGHYL